MSKEKQTKFIDRQSKWKDESTRIRKVQISFDFPDSADVLLRTLAAHEHQAPSTLVRTILGMPTSHTKRARIGVSFNDSELNLLAERYGVDVSDRAEIRRRVTDEVTKVLSFSQEVDITQNESGETTATNDLIDVSDEIYNRFQSALMNREGKKTESNND